MVESVAVGFDDRVKALKHSWEETHFLVTLAGRKDRRSQSALLEAMYRWCQESVLTIESIYGRALEFELTLGLDSVSANLGFSVALRGGESLVAWLEESSARAGEWRISLFTRSADPRSGLTPMRPPRGTRSWTRSSVEQALLALVAGYERGRSVTAFVGRNSPPPPAKKAPTRTTRAATARSSS